jgi:hypothetical protein
MHYLRGSRSFLDTVNHEHSPKFLPNQF